MIRGGYALKTCREILMPAAAWRRVLCCATLLLLLEGISGCAQSKGVVVPARPTDAGKIAFPALPPGAGEIAKDAPQQFTQTGTGLRYRILRVGKGAVPIGTDTVKTGGCFPRDWLIDNATPYIILSRNLREVFQHQ